MLSRHGRELLEALTMPDGNARVHPRRPTGRAGSRVSAIAGDGEATRPGCGNPYHGPAMTPRLDPAAPVAMRECATLELGGTRLDPQVLAAFADRHHITRISLFGSALKGEDGPESDIDLLVQFEPDHVPGFLALATMETELSELLDGRRVDLRTAADLSRYFRDDVVREARLLHAR